MTTHELERITAVAREDMARLLKEYARTGYKAVHGRGDEDFDAMWKQAFDPDPGEEKPGD